MKEYNIENFNEFIDTRPDVKGIGEWFRRMNSDFKKAQKENRVDGEMMYELCSFWDALGAEYGNDIFAIIMDLWEKPPKVVKEITDYQPAYRTKKAEKAEQKLSSVERQQYSELLQLIWDKQKRMDINISYFDWDADESKDLAMAIPRLHRDEYKDSLRFCLAEMIYNRGSMITRFFTGRGLFEYMGVITDEDGVWRTLSETEIRTRFVGENGMPLELSGNVLTVAHEKIKIIPEKYLS